MKEIVICDADSSLLSEIRKHRVQAYTQYKSVIPSAHWESLRQSLSSEIDSAPDVEVIVAKKGEEILGSVVLFPPKSNTYGDYIEELDYPEIRMLAVSKEARGHGIASALVKECINRSKQKGFSSIGLHTGEFMIQAIKLYEGLGFERLPQFDFEPANDGIIVRAYNLKLE